MIQIEDLSFTYPDKTVALANVSCLFKHQKIALLGANGSGKSTLLQHLNGLLLAQTGVVKIFGETVTKKNLRKIREAVGIVFDNPDNQLFAPTVYEDVAFAPRNKGLSEDQVLKVVTDVLATLNISHLQSRAPYNLSLGQKKKVAIAGALAMEPRLLVFDEPFLGLDGKALKEFLQLLEILSNSGHTIILTTHDVDVVYHWADECMVLCEGRKMAHGTVEILEDEELMKRVGLTVPNLYALFKETKYRPKTIAEAKNLIHNFAKEMVL